MLFILTCHFVKHFELYEKCYINKALLLLLVDDGKLKCPANLTNTDESYLGNNWDGIMEAEDRASQISGCSDTGTKENSLDQPAPLTFAVLFHERLIGETL